MHSKQAVVVFSPEPTREYGPIEVIGVFTSIEFAQDYIDNHIELTDGYEATAVEIDGPEST